MIAPSLADRCENALHFLVPPDRPHRRTTNQAIRRISQLLQSLATG